MHHRSHRLGRKGRGGQRFSRSRVNGIPGKSFAAVRGEKRQVPVRHGVLGGTSAYTTPCSKHGKVDAGEAYDVAYCCK